VTTVLNKDLLLGDPLGDVTRKERRMLLVVSVIAIALIKIGLMPTKITALGVEFTETNQQALLWIVSMINVYFLFAFVIYATADFFVWQKILLEEYRAEMKRHYDEETELLRKEESEMYGPQVSGDNYFDNELKAIEDKIENIENQFQRKFKNLKRMSWYVSLFRAFFEFGLPVVVGIYSVFLLWKY
jgi:hypothetical protein